MNIVLVGKPGCGKGSLSNYLLNLENSNFYQLSPGDLMKKIMSQDTEEAAWLKSLLDKGNFAPDNYTIDLINKEIALLKEKNPNISIVYDGFPRTKEQARMMCENLPVDLVVHFKVEDSTIIERIANRLIHLPSGRIYNLKNNPPKQEGLDDVTGEPLIRRKDDDPSIIQTRLDNYNNLTHPAYEVLKNHFPTLEVDGLKSPKDIAQEIFDFAKSLQQKPKIKP